MSSVHVYPEDPTLPYDIYKPQNIAIVMSYFSIGLVGSFLSTPLNVYLVTQLNAEPQMQNTIGILQTLPWSMKLAFGFLSDALPIRGMHRKPYLAIGALLYSSAFILYSVIRQNNVALLAICVFLGTVGLIQMDVMADTMCVQRSKFEPEETKGQMQASCYSIRFAGSLIGAIMGATLCNQESWGWGLDFFQVSFLNGLIPFVLVTPWLFTLRETYRTKPPSRSARYNSFEEGLEMGSGSSKSAKKGTGSVEQRQEEGVSTNERSLLLPKRSNNSETNSKANLKNDDTAKGEKSGDEYQAQEEDDVQTIYDQLNEIWLTVQLRSVWRPMTFVFAFNLFQIPNVAWQSYLQLTLNFPAWILGATVILGSFMTFAGVLAYKYFFFKTSWRRIYVWTVMLTCFFSMLQLVLIFQLNQKYLHLSNYLFSLGDDVISAYISGIQFLPLCIMYMRLCPEGAEGASYAMLTTFGNIALVCASNLGNLLSNVWDVSNSAMRAHDVSGLWKLSVLTSCLAVLPLSLLFLLPRDAEEQDELSKSQVRSRPAGIAFLIVLFGSLAWTTCTAIVRVTS